MLLTSMRSSYVIGFDINSEYFDFHQTVLNGVWHFGHLNPYEAMLSLTVLPASLHALIGGQDVWIFKLGYPALFALFPVAVFELGTRFLSRRAAFVAAALVVSQAYFFQQQPEIARQELALLIFAGIVGVLFDTSLGRDVQVILVSVLGLTLVVCHYSTTYITIGLCLMASVVAKLLSFRRPTKIPVARWLIAAGVMALGAVIWYLPATHSTSNVTAAVQSIRQSGFQLLPGRQKGESIISAYFNGLRQAPASLKQYQASIARYYSENRSYLVPLPQATNPAYNLRAAPSLAVPDRSPLLGSFLNDAELLVQQTINAAAVIGALVFALRRRGDPLTRMVGAIGVASFAVLVASRLSGALRGRLQLIAAVSPVPFRPVAPRGSVDRSGREALQVTHGTGDRPVRGLQPDAGHRLRRQLRAGGARRGRRPGVDPFQQRRGPCRFLSENSGEGDRGVAGQDGATEPCHLRGLLCTASLGSVHGSALRSVRRYHAAHDRPARVGLRFHGQRRRAPHLGSDELEGPGHRLSFGIPAAVLRRRLLHRRHRDIPPMISATTSGAAPFFLLPPTRPARRPRVQDWLIWAVVITDIQSPNRFWFPRVYRVVSGNTCWS